VAYRTILRRLAVPDDAFVEHVVSANRQVTAGLNLDNTAYALIQLGALVAVGAETGSYLSVVEAALRADARPDQIVGALVSVAPIVGSPRVVAAAPRLGLALGYDILEALESADLPSTHTWTA
jgi:4-carboxymuconolactone decarboxylase